MPGSTVPWSDHSRRRAGLVAVAAAAVLAGSAVRADGTRPPVDTLFERGERFDFAAPEPGTYELPVLRPAADGEVLDIEGRPRRLSAFMQGRITLLSLIYTGCRTECPEATAILYDLFYASERDRELAEEVALVSLSFDPERDTPEAMAAYGYAARADPGGKSPWHFLTTASRRDLAPILAGYGQVIDVRPPGGHPDEATINHLLRVFLIDRRGRVRNIYGLGFLDPRLVVADIRTLLIEEQREGF
jgi:cytochrome oxidase Cu insertion factor (SCO1/SenC/PrrC family)